MYPVFPTLPPRHTFEQSSHAPIHPSSILPHRSFRREIKGHKPNLRTSFIPAGQSFIYSSTPSNCVYSLSPIDGLLSKISIFCAHTSHIWSWDQPSLIQKHAGFREFTSLSKRTGSIRLRRANSECGNSWPPFRKVFKTSWFAIGGRQRSGGCASQVISQSVCADFHRSQPIFNQPFRPVPLVDYIVVCKWLKQFWGSREKNLQTINKLYIIYQRKRAAFFWTCK